jgi:hypothetical protein
MDHITTWEEDYKGNNTSPSLQSPIANSSTPSCVCQRVGMLNRQGSVTQPSRYSLERFAHD